MGVTQYAPVEGRGGRRSPIRLIILLLFPVSLYIGLSYYAPHLLSLDASMYNHCSPEQWSDGEWVRKPIEPKLEQGVFAASDFEGCASQNRLDWHLGSDLEGKISYKRLQQSNYVWLPSRSCRMGVFDKEAFIKKLVEKGGWLIVGDSVAEEQMYSLSCILYPHVLHKMTAGTPEDFSLPQTIFLDPSSSLIRTIKFPPKFNMAVTPLISFRRSDLLFSRAELLKLQASLHPHSQQYPPIFAEGKTWDRSLSSYLLEFLAPLPQGNYRALIVDTGGQWNHDTFLFPKMEGILKFFNLAMYRWVEKVADVLDKGDETKRRRVVVKPHAGGHDVCADATAPTLSSALAVGDDWTWMKEFNFAFENATRTFNHKRIHYLDIIRPARLRPDAHLLGDCHHWTVGTGVVEGWTEYVSHFLSGGYEFLDYVPEKGIELGHKGIELGNKVGSKFKEYVDLDKYAYKEQLSVSSSSLFKLTPYSDGPANFSTSEFDDMSEPYDPYLPSGNSSSNPTGAPTPAGNSKTAAIQAQIDDTVGIMRENITKVAERGEHLNALQDKTDNLAVSAQGFRRGANRVRKQMWWKDMKMRIYIGIGITVLIIIIVVPIVVKK